MTTIMDLVLIVTPLLVSGCEKVQGFYSNCSRSKNNENNVANEVDND